VKKLEVLDLEKNLKKYKDTETDIEILERENAKLCEENNVQIRKLEEEKNKIELLLEAYLKKSKEEKIECKWDKYIGTVKFTKMPDEWIYVDEILMAWIISLPQVFKNLYLKVVTTVMKGDLKKQIIADNETLFEKSKLVDEPNELMELFLVEQGFGEEFKGKDHKVEGITIKRQDPKFSITIKKKK